MDFNFRQYDPQLGRFNAVDPLAASTDMISPYAAMGNAPESQIDPNGTSNFLFHFGEDGGMGGSPFAPGSWLSDPNKAGSMGVMSGGSLDNSPSGMGDGDMSSGGGGSSDQSAMTLEDIVEVLSITGGTYYASASPIPQGAYATNFGDEAPGGVDGNEPQDGDGDGKKKVTMKSADEYDYSQDVIPGKMEDDWNYIRNGEGGNMVSQCWKTIKRDWNAKDNVAAKDISDVAELGAAIPAVGGVKMAAKTVKTLQTGGHTLNNATLKALGLTKQQGKNAIEALKKTEGLPNNAHFKIMSDGSVVNPHNGINYGKLFDYLP